MAKQRVYAALEIGDRDIRLVVLEAFDGRFLVLRTECIPTDGVKDFLIVDQQEVVDSIQKAVRNAQEALGYHIEKVLLAIPSAEVTRISESAEIELEEGADKIRLFHIQQGVEKARAKIQEKKLIFVNINKIEYMVDDVFTEKMPIGKEAEKVEVSIDLLYANRELVYSYVDTVEKAGLEVIDIFVDAYAQAQETAALSLSKNQPVVLITLEARHTVLTLISKGKIESSRVLDYGFESFIKPLREKYHLDEAVADRLLSNLFTLEQEKSDAIIYIEQQKDVRVEITASELAKSVLPNIRRWIADINEACEPLLVHSKIRFILTGQGVNLPILRELGSAFAASLSIYKQSAPGARNGLYAAGLGMGYAWNERLELYPDTRISANGNELEASIESIARKPEEETTSFTMKLKRAMLAGDK